MIQLLHVTKQFGKQAAVNDVSLTIEDGKIAVFIGPSGCGKTTTLRMINKLVSADKGDIQIDGVSIADLDPVKLRRRIGYVIQDIGLFPHFSVFDNIAAVPRLLKWDENKIKDRVDELLDLVTLNSSYKDKYPLQLSGGEKQRVGLARALAADPDILLMDEPFGAIDPINRVKLQDLFLEVQEEIRKTIVFVTHDIDEAIKLGDKIAIMNAGRLVQYDTVPEILEHPANEFVEDLLGQDRNLKALNLEKVSDYMIKDHPATADPKKGFPQIGPNATVVEALSAMLEAGASQLVVSSRKHEPMGVITLKSIFQRVQGAQSDKKIDKGSGKGRKAGKPARIRKNSEPVAEVL